jgi:hydrogenase nickel incorporation protein HypA/HybF
MHELSIAMSIVEICTEELGKAGADKVTLVELEIGSLSGVEIDALEFSWDVAVKDTAVESAPLVIRRVDAAAKCRSCHAEFPIDNFFSPCPQCGEYGFDVIRGKELQIKALTVE